jgi:pilus assembly protein CpaF
MSTARAILESEVRELVRRRALDPAADPLAVATLIDEAIGDYIDRATM